MKVARWRDGAELGEGFVVGDRVVPFPNGLRVAQVLAQGLPAARRLFERVADERGTALDSVRLLAPLVPTSMG